MGTRGFATLFIALTAVAASAQHDGFWARSDDFYIRVNNMVDFDQLRATDLPLLLGFPNDGSMYCAPTSSANLLAYIDLHGYDDEPGVLGPGIRPWEDNSDLSVYQDATEFIRFLGIEQSTDTDDGTFPSAARASLDSRLPDELFDVVSYFRVRTWSPKVRNLGTYLRQGAIVNLAFGVYEVDRTTLPPTLMGRNGGHMVTLTKADKRANQGYDINEFVIEVADPASDDGNLLNQSPFTNDVFTIRDQRYIEEGDVATHSVYAFDPPPDDGLDRVIDYALAIFPTAAWGVWPAEDTVTLWSRGFDLNGTVLTPTAQSFTAPDGRPIVYTQISPDRGFAAVVVDGDGNQIPPILFILDLAAGNFNRVVEAPGPVSVTFCRDLSLCVLQNPSASQSFVGIRRILPEKIDPGGPGLDFPIDPPQRLPIRLARDSAADDELNLVLILGTAQMFPFPNVVLFYDPSDPANPRTFFVPPTAFVTSPPEAIRVMPGTGEIVLADFDDGRLVIAAPASTYGAGGTQLALLHTIETGGPIHSISALAPDLIGVIPTVGDGSYQMFQEVNGAWAPAEAAPPIAAARFIRQGTFTRSRTNFDPAQHTGPAWFNIVPDQLLASAASRVPCRVDFARPFEQLDGSDVAAYVGILNDQRGRADFSAPFGVYDIFDAIAYLELFDAGCP